MGPASEDNMFTNESYCGRCHQFTEKSTPVTYGAPYIRCGCSMMAGFQDFSKDPNCKNPRHAHHDPESPVVKSDIAIRECEDRQDAGYLSVECNCGLEPYEAPVQHSVYCPRRWWSTDGDKGLWSVGPLSLEDARVLAGVDKLIGDMEEDAKLAVKPLTTKQVEERRENLAFIRENIPSGDVLGNDPSVHLFTTTLLMQEQWLATVDDLRAYRDEERRRGDSWQESWEANAARVGELQGQLDGFAADLDHAEEERDSAREELKVWHDLYESEAQRLAETNHQLTTAQLWGRDANILRGLRLQQCLGPTGGLALTCPECYDDIAKYCAPCYLRAIHLTPEMHEGIREGVQDVKEGRVTSWEDMQARYTAYCAYCHDNGTACSCGDTDHVPCQGDHVVAPCYNCQPFSGKAELDEILEETNQQVEEDCPLYGSHVWGKTGKANLTDRGAGVAWGPARCMRCDELAPEEKEWRETYPGNIIGGARPKYLQERADD